MTDGVATEPQVTRRVAEKLVGYGFGVLPAPAAMPEVKAAGDQYRAGDSETALKIVAGDLLPYSEKDVKLTLVNNLSTDRGPDGRKVSPSDANERRRYTDSEAMAQDIRQFVEKGVATPQFKAVLRNYLMTNCPALRDIALKSSDPASAIATVVDTMLNDPAYKDGLRQIFNERLNPTKKLTKEEDVRTAQMQLDELKAQLLGEVTPAQIKVAQDAVDAANLKLAALQPKALELQTKAARFQRLTEALPSLNQEMIKLEPAVNPLINEISTLKLELGTLDPTDPTDATRIAAINARVTTIEGDKNYKSYMQRLALVQEQADLGKDVADLQTDLIPAQQEVERAKQDLKDLQDRQKTALNPTDKAKIEAKIKQKEAELADARDELEAEMIKFSRDVTHMPQDAAEAYINTAFSKLKTNWTEEAKKRVEKQKSDQEALALIAADKLSNQWREDKNVKGITIKKANRDRALNFLAEAFKPGGVANVEARINALDNVALDHLGLTPQEITAFKAKWNDAEFRKTQADSLAKQALADYFIAGGRMSQDMVVALVSSDWGKGLLEQGRTRANEILTAAKGNKSLLGIKDKALQDIDEIKKSSAEHIKNNWWKYGLAILVLLLILSKVGIG